jgi:hypothetical protein
MLARSATLWLGGLAATACSLIVDGEPAALRCSQEGRVGPPACDEGFVCSSGVCRISEPVSQGGGPFDSSQGGDDEGEGGEDSRRN